MDKSASISLTGKDVIRVVGGIEPLGRSIKSGKKHQIGTFPASGAKLMTEVVGQDRLYSIEAEDPAAVAQAHEEVQRRLKGERLDTPPILLH